MNARIKEIELNDDDTVKCFQLADGSTIEGDLYVSAMPGRSFVCNILSTSLDCSFVHRHQTVLCVLLGFTHLCFCAVNLFVRCETFEQQKKLQPDSPCVVSLPSTFQSVQLLV